MSDKWPDVVEWDEYGQGYDHLGRLIACICGARLIQPGYLEKNGSPHYCPYDIEDVNGEMV